MEVRNIPGIRIVNQHTGTIPDINSFDPDVKILNPDNSFNVELPNTLIKMYS